MAIAAVPRYSQAVLLHPTGAWTMLHAVSSCRNSDISVACKSGTPRPDCSDFAALVSPACRGVDDLEFMYFDASRGGPASVRAGTMPSLYDSASQRTELRTTLFLNISMLDAAGRVVYTQMGYQLGANFTLAAAGRYYISIRGSGFGTFWPSYGSRCGYQLTVTYPTGTNSTPPASPTPRSPSPSPQPSPSVSALWLIAPSFHSHIARHLVTHAHPSSSKPRRCDSMLC